LEDTTIEDVLKTFETSYAQKDYTQAQKILETKASAFARDTWEYNMGTVLARRENYPEARFHLLEAQALGLNAPELTQNLSLVEERLDLPRLEKSLNTQDHFLKAGLILSDGYFSTLSLLGLLVGIFVIKAKFSFQRLAVFFTLIVTPLVFKFWMASLDQFVAIKPAVFQDGPSTIFSKIGDIPAGVRIVGKRDGAWIKILYPSRFEGWSRIEDLKKLESSI
jgi:hypothetical protein